MATEIVRERNHYSSVLCAGVSLYVYVPVYLVGACQEWHETKAEKRSGWCRHTVFSGSQMAWGAECEAETRGSRERGGRRNVCAYMSDVCVLGVRRRGVVGRFS